MASTSSRPSSSPHPYAWELLIPAQRYVFAVADDGSLVEFDRPGEQSYHRFRRYQALKADFPVHGMIAWPNTVLLRGEAVIVVDPGLRMQGPPLPLALRRAGLQPSDVDLVVNTHAHDDHVQGNVYFPGVTVALHERELGAPGAEPGAGAGQTPTGPQDGPHGGPLRLLQGDEGELVPGVRFLRTPGHTEGSICLVFDSAEGRVVVGGDTVGPLPVYFQEMRLPEAFPGRDRLLESWSRIRALGPALVIPGHNPPLVP